MKYLDHFCFGRELIILFQTYFDSFGVYLNENELLYSKDVAKEWIKQSSFACNIKDKCIMAFKMLDNAYEKGSARLGFYIKNEYMNFKFNDNFQDLFECYLKVLNDRYSYKTFLIARERCSNFLAFIQRSGITRIEDISYSYLYDYYEYDRKNGPTTANYGYLINFLVYAYGDDKIPYGFTIIFRFFSEEKGAFWNEINNATHYAIQNAYDSDDSCVSCDDLLTYKEKLTNAHKEKGYSRNVIFDHNRIIDLLFLFLTMNNYVYCPKVAEIWFDAMVSNNVFSRYKRRTLSLLAQFHNEGSFDLNKFFTNKCNALEALPIWCYKVAKEYLELKKREGWAESTLVMIRSSISRFCNYLNDIGIKDFMDITAEHIKLFNQDDVHLTPKGKNAYNIRIRAFLLYLGENGYLSHKLLYVSLTKVSTSAVNIIKVLDKEKLDIINDSLKDKESDISHRSKAMISLGLYMGLRASDIVSLKINDVDWKDSTLHIIQEKTNVEVVLPMPISVGNAMYKYITEERPNSDTPHIFLSKNAPYKPLNRSVCNRALAKVLPNSNAKGIPFHITRKTFATNLLRKGIGVEKVSDALGHTSIANVHDYLSLDEERIRLCSISLNDMDIGGW